MNIEHANSIALSAILEKAGFKPVKETGKDLWYLSPLRNEKTASFHVDLRKNVWFDFGANKGGDSIAFVCAYLEATAENHTASDALRWLKNMMNDGVIIGVVRDPNEVEDKSKLTLKKTKPLQHRALIHYLESRGIPLYIAQSYLKEVHVHHNGNDKSYFALGLKNESGGYEIRNPYFKGCIRPKNITFIRGEIPKPNGIHIFEGFMDYLSIITQQGKPLENDAIILNSLACMRKATAYIKNYGYRVAYTWLDNDDAGKEATEAFAEFFKTEENLQHRPMNKLYAKHKDVNDWQMYRLGLGQ